MNNVIKSKGGIFSLKKKYYKQFLTKKANNNININNSVNIPLSYKNDKCTCDCHEEKAINNNNLHNYNSEVKNSYISSKLEQKQYQQSPLERNKSSNYLLSLENKDLSFCPSKKYSTNYNYNFNYFDNVENGILNKKPKSQEKINNLYQNEKINLIPIDYELKEDNLQKIDSMNEIKNNLNKRSIVHKNKYESENNSIYGIDINKNIFNRYYNNAKPKKYSYGGRTIIVSSNAKNHSFKEIIVKSGSSDKIMNKRKIINITENNIFNSINNNNNNFNFEDNYKTEEKTDVNHDFNPYENNNFNTNHREMKKSTSENYLFNHHYHIHHIHKCRCHCVNHMNYFRNNNNCYQNNNILLIDQNKEDKYRLNLNRNYQNNYLLTYEKENKSNNIHTPIKTLNYENNYKKYHIPIETFNPKKRETINNCNDNKYNYNINNKNYYFKNKRTIPKSNSFDNYSLVKKNYSNMVVDPKNSAIGDFNYNNFKLKAKLGLLKREIYKNERNMNTGNKNRIKLNYQLDKKYLENILNNQKRSNIKDIVLEKTKKALEEKKLKQEGKYNINKNQKNYKNKYKDENQILSNLKKQLLENNKKNNKYVVKSKLNVFK